MPDSLLCNDTAAVLLARGLDWRRKGMDFRLAVDSCCELPEEWCAGQEVVRVPLRMTLGEEEFLDDGNLNRRRFLRKMERYPGRPMSACPSPQAWLEAISPDKPTILLTLSSQLSGSYSSARIACELSSNPQTAAFDSKTASAGESLLALRILEIAGQCRKFETAVERIQRVLPMQRTFFLLETLDQLVKSGRIGRIAGKLAGALQVKPVLGSDGDGNIAQFGRARGSERGMGLLVERLIQAAGPARGRVVLSHCENLRAAEELAEILRRKGGFPEVRIAEMSGISSMYASRGGIVAALFGSSKQSGTRK